MEIPIEIFLPLIGLSLAMAVISFLPKERPYFLLMLAGSIIAFSSLTTDTILLGKIPSTSVVSGSTTTYTFIDNTFEFTEWYKIFFMLIGVVIMLAGAIAWKTEEKPLL